MIAPLITSSSGFVVEFNTYNVKTCHLPLSSRDQLNLNSWLLLNAQNPCKYEPFYFAVVTLPFSDKICYPTVAVGIIIEKIFYLTTNFKQPLAGKWSLSGAQLYRGPVKDHLSAKIAKDLLWYRSLYQC